MSYHIYTTDGIILKRATFGEANIMLYVLTKDLGLILASARSARLSVSKLRPALQEYSSVSLSCIKGKSGWKITNVVGKSNLFFDYPVYSRRVLAQVTFVLLKMIQGESSHPEIFETTHAGLEFLKEVPKEDIQSFEILAVLRILYHLGYVASSINTEIFITDTLNWNNELLKKIKDNKTVLVEVINKALRESHL